MINRSEMFKRAHLSCRLKHFWHKEKPYREVFASCLRYEYEQARLRTSWAAKAAARQAQREEQNLNGVPLASCAFDYPRPIARIIGRREISAIGA